MVAADVEGLLALEAGGAVFILLAALRLQRSYRLVGAPSLRRLLIGFWLLAASQVAALVLELLVVNAGDTIPRDSFDAFDVAFWLYYTTLLGGLAWVFASFGRHPFRWAPALAPVLLQAGPILQLVTVVELFFVVLHAGLNHIARKASGSLFVSVGFFFVFVAHTLNLRSFTPLEPRWWPAELLNLAGFVILWRAVRGPRARSDA